MAKFPVEESKILALAQEIAEGLAANTDVYPAPPVPTAKLLESLAACVAARDEAIAAQAASEAATGRKKTAIRRLVEEMRDELRYAEATVHQDNARLKLIGWSGPKAPTPLASPGRVRDLVVLEQGKGTVSLGWKKPADGGRVAAYKIQRRERADGSDWMNADTTTDTVMSLSGQERGKALEFCVLGINKAGQGAMSNTVTVVL